MKTTNKIILGVTGLLMTFSAPAFAGGEGKPIEPVLISFSSNDGYNYRPNPRRGGFNRSKSQFVVRKGSDEKYQSSPTAALKTYIGALTKEDSDGHSYMVGVYIDIINVKISPQSKSKQQFAVIRFADNSKMSIYRLIPLETAGEYQWSGVFNINGIITTSSTVDFVSFERNGEMELVRSKNGTKLYCHIERVIFEEVNPEGNGKWIPLPHKAFIYDHTEADYSSSIQGRTYIAPNGNQYQVSMLTPYIGLAKEMIASSTSPSGWDNSLDTSFVILAFESSKVSKGWWSSSKTPSDYRIIFTKEDENIFCQKTIIKDAYSKQQQD